MATPGNIIAVGKLLTPGGKQGPKGDVGALPIGVTCLWVAGGTPPNGWLEADGSAISRTLYPEYFALVGTTYGVGDGSTTFNLPDARGRTAIGAGQGASLTNRVLAAKGGEEAHADTVAEMPAHQHNLTFGPGFDFTPTGSPTGWLTVVATSLGTSSAGSGQAHNTMQPFIVWRWIIKVSQSGGVSPLADTTQDGLLRKVSGLTTDFVDGTNHCQDLRSAIKILGPQIYNSIGNPTFEVDQRNVGGAITVTTSTWALDRWQFVRNAGTFVATGQQTAGLVSAPGTNFAITSRFYRATLTTAQATLTANDILWFNQYIEGARLRKLISDVHSISLLVRSSVAGLKFGVALRDGAGTPAWSLTKLCTIPTANTWTLITLPALPLWKAGGTWGITSGSLGYQISITLASGSTYTSSANDVWVAGNLVGALGQDNFASKPVNSTFDLAYVQHEAGGFCNLLSDPDFETNLRSCQRYYSKCISYPNLACQGNWILIGTLVPSTTSVRCNIRFPVEMAKSPTLRMVGNSATLNTVYLEAVGQVATSGSYAPTASGLNACFLNAAGPAVYSDVLGEWDSDTGW